MTHWRSGSRKQIWLLCIGIMLGLWGVHGIAQGEEQSVGEVRVGVRTAFFIEQNVGSITAQERAEIVNRRIERILTDPKLNPSRIKVTFMPDGTPVITLDDLMIIEVTAASAEAAGTTPELLAETRARILRSEITQLKPLYQKRGNVSVKTLSEHRILLLILQVALLLLAARTCGELMARIGQPPVIGQLLAGILLGRSLFGAAFPDVHALIFPVEATQSYLLEVVSWLGVIFLLMLTGMETDIALIRQQGRPALWTSVAGIVAPFVFGFGVGYMLPAALLTTPEQRLILAIFLGTTLSVSSVPVIAKILMDMRLLRRNIGQIILAAALAHDTIGWIILAVVAGLASSGSFSFMVVGKALFGTLAFAAFSLTIGQRLVIAFLRWVNDNVNVEQSLLTAVVLLMLLSAGITQFIGVHAVLGAFIMGVVLSSSPLVGKNVIHPIEAITMGVFAPIFFAAAGLYVNLSVLLDPALLVIVLAVTGAACAGKIIGCYFGGIWGGLGKWEALSVGLGTNARGAMGLIVGILGFSLGILTIDMFSIIIIMAVVTTAMTPPLLTWALRQVKPSPEEQARLDQEERQAQSFLGSVRRILLPTRGGPDTQLASQLLHALGQYYPIEVTALYISPKEDAADSKTIFQPVVEALSNDNTTVVTRAVESAQPVPTILQEARRGYDLLTLGCGHDTGSSGKVFGSIVDAIALETPTPLLVVRAPREEVRFPLKNILLPITGVVHTAQSAEVAVALARAHNARVTALYVVEERDEILFWPARGYESPTVLAYQVVSQVAALGEPFGVQVEAVVRTAAHAAPEIVSAAHEIGADLILLSGSPRPTQRLFLGSTVSYVLAHAHCAVSVIRP